MSRDAIIDYIVERLPPVGAVVHSDQSTPDYPDIEYREYDKRVFAVKLLDTVEEAQQIGVFNPESRRPSEET